MTSLVRWLLLLLFCSAAPASAGAQDVAAYRALVAQDERLAHVGYRLALANAPFCNQLERNPGWVLHDQQQYPDPETATAAFTFRLPIAVAAIVPGGAADVAGIKVGDGLAGIADGSSIDYRAPARKHSAARIEHVQQEIRDQLAEDIFAAEFETAAGRRRFALVPPRVCASRFWVDARSKLDAGADGHAVRVTEGLMAFTGNDDDQLAAIVAHELAHNILGHRQRLRTKGGTKAILASEIEADRLSVWLMANAGFNPRAALLLAERYGRKTGLGIFSAGTHLRWRNRVKVMQAEIDTMSATPRRNGLLPPPLLSDRE